MSTAHSGHTNINSTIPLLRCCILLHHIHFTQPFSEPCCSYKLSLSESLFSMAKYLSDSSRASSETSKSHFSQRWAYRDDSSMGRRFNSRGGQLRNSPCIMTGTCLKYPGHLTLHLSILPTLTLTSFLPRSELHSSFQHLAPTPTCCSAGLPHWVTT